MQIKIQTRYSTEDPKCSSYYCAVEVFVDGKKVREWGDDYHDKGYEKAEGFVEGLLWSADYYLGAEEAVVARTQVADFEC